MFTRLLDYLFAALFGTFQRMIFWELFRVFLLCLLALAGVFTLLAVLQQIQFGVSLSQALRMLPLLVPTSIPWITPPSCLFASCVVYGRMANDNEAVALKAAGVDLLSVLRPAVVLGAIACGFTAYLQFDVTPASWRGSREVLIEDPEEAIGLVLKRKQTLEFASGDSLMKMSVRDVQVGTRRVQTTDETGEVVEREVPEHRLLDVVVKKRDAASPNWLDPEFVARTHSAVLRVQLDRGTSAADADSPAPKKVQLVSEHWESWSKSNSQGTGMHTPRPEDLEFDLPSQFDLEVLRRENGYNSAMVDWVQLPVTAAEVFAIANEHRTYAEELAKLPDGPLSPEVVADFQAEVGIPPEVETAARLSQIQDHRNRTRMFERVDRTMRYEYYLRPAIAFGCLLFAVLGCPVGLWANRADYLSIFVICFLPALIVYYPIMFMVGGYARDGKIPMALGVWTANAVLALGAVVLSWRLIRR